jgi:hypothetical protein
LLPLVRCCRYEQPDSVVLLLEPDQAGAADAGDGQAEDDVGYWPLGNALSVKVKQAFHSYKIEFGVISQMWRHWFPMENFTVLLFQN